MKLLTTFAAVALALAGTLAFAQAPANDTCESCVSVAVPSTTSGTTVGATQSLWTECHTELYGPQVWYSVEGTGNTLTATTCLEGTNYDTKLGVFCEGCETLTCVGGNDDNPGYTNFCSTFSWGSQAGVEYNILVSGYNSVTGNFDLGITDDGIPATPEVDCGESDADSDGVPDAADLCPNTVIREGIPKGGNPLGVNRWALYTSGDGDFDTTAPRGRGPQLSFSIEDTAGCSCEQILSKLGIAGQGHEFFGCSISVMQTWIDQITGP